MGQVLDGNQMREASCTEELRAMRDALDILGGKWKLMILRYLANRESQEIHFKKMEREIQGISAKVLTKELRDLELNLLVALQPSEDPVKVFYKITAYGKSVFPVTESSVSWGLEYREKVKQELTALAK
ncbi:winged helix-turn-helix transcriptional regulator [Sphingobacterium multivorum]|uniref:winged helix-turn-helix transcriptional regulator n=1 Tax=Sphingobacterium multivorum TaxID=28454 RepID=UPI0028A805F6|nr:helix-turn-helix domain-containing protein [Sphingobacterium multivorum]